MIWGCKWSRVKGTYLAAALAGLAAMAAPNIAAAQASKQEASAQIAIRNGIEILRDRYGVPHIRADSEAAALFGLGYTHAQDRLWQMEYQRRLASGRLAEILGQSALPSDKLFRTLGLRRSTTTVWANYRGRDRELIQAYVSGINAYLSDQYGKHVLPAEFEVLGFTPERWQPEDVLIWIKVLAWVLGDNWDGELLRSQLTAKLGPEKAAQLMPAYTEDGPIIVAEGDRVKSAPARSQGRRKKGGQSSAVALGNEAADSLLAFNRSIIKQLGLGGQGLGSNNWVLSGSRTTSGNSIFASDPHLDSQSPSVFYLAHVSGGDLNAIGATLPGLPLVVLGHNDRIAWGETNATVDVQDLYVEHINSSDEAEYEGEWEPVQIITETIQVKDQPDTALPLRVTRHGPLISDLVNPMGPALALRWTMLEANQDGGLRSLLRAQRASNWKTFKNAFKEYGFHPQNMLYSDADGDIGYLLPGPIPIRARGDGSAPVPGWTSEYEWTGYIPLHELPRSFNPPQGYIVTANNQIAGQDYPYRLSNGYAAPYRATRITELIESKGKLSRRDVEEMQTDVLAVHARESLPIMLRVNPGDERGKRAIELLRRWDYNVTGDSAGAAIFEAWYIKLAERVFADELGDSLWKSYSAKAYMVGMALSTALQRNQAWCDDVRTPGTEVCADTILAALNDALERMAHLQDSPQLSSWRWDVVHHALFPHSVFDSNPVLGPLFSRSIASGGDRYTVNVSSHPDWNSYEAKHVPAYRQAVDFDDLDGSQFVIAPGQSGTPFNSHYDDLLSLWQSGRGIPMLFSRQSVEREVVERTVLTN
jgi:penicillin amidase